MTLEERMRRRTEADARCLAAYHASGGPAVGAALVAVGGFGRGELGAHSDLDVMLIGEAGVELESVAERIWYPLWDAGERVDHAVRTLAEIGDVADLKLRLSLLDARHLAGDPDVTRRLRTLVLDDWRRSARSRLPALHRLTLDRQDRAGELAHLAVPDLKDAAGGLRDVTVLRALAASWLVDLPHPELNAVRVGLLDVRDALQVLVGRASHRVEPEHWDGLACRLGLADGAAAQAHVRGWAGGPSISRTARGVGPRPRWPGPPPTRASAGRCSPHSAAASRWPTAKWCWRARPGRPPIRS